MEIKQSFSTSKTRSIYHAQRQSSTVNELLKAFQQGLYDDDGLSCFFLIPSYSVEEKLMHAASEEDICLFPSKTYDFVYITIYDCDYSVFIMRAIDVQALYIKGFFSMHLRSRNRNKPTLSAHDQLWTQKHGLKLKLTLRERYEVIIYSTQRELSNLASAGTKLRGALHQV